MPATFTELLPARKASKHSAINWTPAEGENAIAGTLTIHTDKATVAYTLAEFPTGWHHGRGFTLTKGDGESYSVFCSASDASADSCDCKGCTYTGTCKHKDSVRALISNGWL